MKKKHYLYILPAAMLAFAACNQEQDYGEKANGSVAVRIKAGIEDFQKQTRSFPTGDVTAQALFSTGDQLYVSDGEAHAIYSYNGISGEWSPIQTDNYLIWKEAETTYNAFYPSNSTTASLTSFSVPHIQHDEPSIALADYMTGQTTYPSKPADETLQLAMQRHMARIVIRIAAFNDFGKTQPYVDTLSISSGYEQLVIDGTPSGNPVGIAPLKGGTFNGGIGCTYTALVVPGAARADNDFITLRIRHGEEETEMKAAGIPACEAGKSYTYTLTVKKNLLQIDDVTVEEWTDATIPGGEALPSTPQPMYTIVLEEPGTLTAVMLDNAISEEGQLAIAGAMNTTHDLTLLRDWAYNIQDRGHHVLKTLDLSGVTGWTCLPSNAFFNHSALTSYENHMIRKVILPASVTEIGEKAFYRASALSEINLENVTKIEQDAFHDCSSLVELNLKNVTSLGNGVFQGCKSLMQVELGEVNEIPDYCFDACSSLTNIKLDHVTRIGYGAFKGCRSLNNIRTDNIISIGEHGFSGCSALNNINLEKVETLGNDAFISCSSLTEANLPNVKTIGSEVFNQCESLKKVVLSETITAIPYRTFGDCNALTDINLNSITEIGERAFYRCKALSDVNLEKAASIGNNAFEDNTSLQNIHLSNATTIGESAFSGCQSLKQVSLGENLTTLSPLCFRDCESLTSVDLKNATTLLYGAFMGCKQLADIHLDNVTEMQHSVFSHCQSLTSVHIKNLPAIESSAFALCTSLTDVTLGETVTTIKSDAFNGCSALASIDLKNVTALEDKAFWNCTQLVNIDLSKVESIGSNAMYATALQSANLESLLTFGANAFQSCKALTHVTLSEQLSEIPREAFRDCTSLSEINLGHITSVDYQGFYDCASLSMPDLSNIVSLESNAFRGCSSIGKIRVPKLQIMKSSVFSNCGTVTETDFSAVKEIEQSALAYTTFDALDFPNCTKLGSTILLSSTLNSLRFTTNQNITLTSTNALVFDHPESTILYLHESKRPGGNGSPLATGPNVWAGNTWKEIHYVNDNGEEVK